MLLPTQNLYYIISCIMIGVCLKDESSKIQQVSLLFRTCTDSYDMRSVVLKWEDDTPIELYVEKLNLPQFEMIDYYPTDCEEAYKTGNV